ncbi:mitochondrial ribosome-associated GTPase 1 isoform X3 [Chiloscyllium plagiosum]|uniref:mitochondrial ribosome-associated GTPase 1 isoform X3 n=1 Tax=Chiloscyllium plagiosum TaxID=36176 RepID=UPI001CB82CFE|nr:mitochondrial ribosome-associated GTPase 1 isoform X3 [Chiloscyllium plagiosum]
MRGGAALAALRLRTSFEFGNREVAKWFPGHMAKGLKKMQASLKKVDCIIEVHDARIPLSGRNPMFQEALGVRPHLLVLNKMDLADLTSKQIIPAVTELIQKSDRFHRTENLEYCLMVIGVPNVGKSSLINAMRRMYLKKGKASRVGGEPGITRAVLTKIQVCERPLMYLLDTPGVFSPRIESLEVGMKLALCGTILDHLVGEEIIADYLLFTLNKQQKFDYVERYQLGEPCDDLQTVLKKIAVKLGKTQKVKAITGVGDINILMPNYSAAAYDFIRAFRKGELGKVMLD